MIILNSRVFAALDFAGLVDNDPSTGQAIIYVGKLMSDESIELCVRVFRATDRALLLGDREGDAEWVPRSLVENADGIATVLEKDGAGAHVAVYMAEWKARELGWA